jgi:putative membrane protein
MIVYDEGRWSIWFAFRFYGTVMDRAIALALPCAIASVCLHMYFQEYPELADRMRNDFRNNVLQGFSFVLGFLIVFRTQKAYSRWWEGGTLLQQLRGDWFNAFSNLLAFLNQDPDASPELKASIDVFRHKMVRLFSLLYGSALGQVGAFEGNELQYFNIEGFDNATNQALHDCHDRCELILQWIQRTIVLANTSNVIKIAPPILARVYNQLGQGIVKLNNARKIKEFPVPFPIAQLIAFMLILHWLSTVVQCALLVSTPAAAFMSAFLVSFSFWGVNYIAVELENPYGDDPNDLPLVQMQEDLNQSLISLMKPYAFQPPDFNFVAERDGDIVKALVTELVGFASTSSPTKNTDITVATVDQSNSPLVDNCLVGRCNVGLAVDGACTDSSYRDSMHLSPAEKLKRTFNAQTAFVGHGVSPPQDPAAAKTNNLGLAQRKPQGSSRAAPADISVGSDEGAQWHGNSQPSRPSQIPRTVDSSSSMFRAGSLCGSGSPGAGRCAGDGCVPARRAADVPSSSRFRSSSRLSRLWLVSSPGTLRPEDNSQRPLGNGQV